MSDCLKPWKLVFIITFHFLNTVSGMNIVVTEEIYDMNFIFSINETGTIIQVISFNYNRKKGYRSVVSRKLE